MPHWKNRTDDQIERSVIYTGTYGFRDSDALGQVWGHTQKAFETAIRSAFAETGRMYANEDESERAIKDQLWYVGPYAEMVGSIELEETDRKSEFYDDIRHSATGYVP